jgi:hypothetical protein
MKKIQISFVISEISFVFSMCFVSDQNQHQIKRNLRSLLLIYMVMTSSQKINDIPHQFIWFFNPNKSMDLVFAPKWLKSKTPPLQRHTPQVIFNSFPNWYLLCSMLYIIIMMFKFQKLSSYISISEEEE